MSEKATHPVWKAAALASVLFAVLLVLLPSIHQHAADPQAGPTPACVLCVVLASTDLPGPGPSSVPVFCASQIPALASNFPPTQVFSETADGRAPPAGRQTPRVS